MKRRHLHASNQSDKSSTYILDKKTLFLHFVREYIIGLAHSHEYGTEIISITKSLLFEINQVEIDYMAIKNVRLQSKWSIHFSFIKSLILDAPFSISPNQPPYEIRDLSGLKQLEYLQIVYMLLNANSFNGLDKLIKLELIHCYTSEKSLCFDSLSNLQILRIEMLFFPIDLKSLENLKVLMIKGIYKLEYISNVSESITYLQLNSLDSNYNNPEVFFSRVFLPNLIYLKMSCGLLPYIKEQWFRGMKLLKELILNGNCLESLDFCRFNCLSHLEKLDLSDSQIEKLDEGFFMKLKKLKSLNLSNNPILKLGSNKFLGLKNLETLFLDKINWEFIRIEKDAFNGLTNLKKLSLEENFLEYIDPEAFSHTPKLKVLSLNDNRLESIDPKVFSYTPKLTELNICNNEMRIEENIFANLKHLKKIELKDTDLEHINKDILEFLKKSNCELIIL